MTIDYGILYVATGEKCCKEAVLNARRTSSYNPEILISIKTDLVDYANTFGFFDKVLRFNNPSFSYRDKLVGMLDLPYRNTVFLDSDACLIQPSKHLYSILDCVNLAAVSAPVRHPPGWRDHTVPLLFPELNTGVILIRESILSTSLLYSWLELYDSLFVSESQLWDQASFRSVVWSAIQKTNLSFMHLPIEVNLRTTKPWIAGRGMPVHVIHGRYPDFEFLPFVDYLNTDTDRFRSWSEWLRLNPDTEIRPRYDRTFN